MAYQLFEANLLPEPKLTNCKLDMLEQILVKLQSNYKNFHLEKCFEKFHKIPVIFFRPR